MIFNCKDGIRIMDIIERYFDIVVTKVILDTSILSNIDFLSEECYKCPGRICVSIYTLNGIILATRWTNKTGRRNYEIMNMIVNFNISFIIDDINYNKIMKNIILKTY